MEISIDEAMKNFKRIHRYEKVNQFYAFSIESIDVALETMHKYQKITEIVEAWKADVDIDSYDCIADIYEVIGNGKID